MFEKLKSHYNSKYTTISLYVIITVIIIFVLAFIAVRIDTVVSGIGGVLSYIGRLFTPVFIGVVIAYILSPLVDMLEMLLRKVKFLTFKKDKTYRSLAVFSCILLVLIIIILLVGIFIFSITKQISSIRLDDLAATITNYINSFSDSLKDIEDRLAAFNIQSSTIEEYIAKFANTLITGLSNFTGNLVENVFNLSGYISNLVFGLIIAIYLLLEKRVLMEYITIISKAIFPIKLENRLKGYWHDFDNIFSGYIRGQFLDALFMSVVLSISLSIIGIKFGALIGVMAGLCNLIPYFGPIVAFAGTIFFGVLNAQYVKVIIAIAVLLVIQQIDGNIIGPRLMSKGVSLKPVFVLIAIIIGSGIGGVAGMVLAVPVAALIKLFVKRYISARLRKKSQEVIT